MARVKSNRTYAWARQAIGPDGTTTHINPGHAAAGTARSLPRKLARTAGRGASRVNDRSYLYTYDDLHRLIDAKLGKLNSSNDAIDPNGPTPRETHWDLDNLGNWPLTCDFRQRERAGSAEKRRSTDRSSCGAYGHS